LWTSPGAWVCEWDMVESEGRSPPRRETEKAMACSPNTRKHDYAFTSNYMNLRGPLSRILPAHNNYCCSQRFISFSRFPQHVDEFGLFTRRLDWLLRHAAPPYMSIRPDGFVRLDDVVRYTDLGLGIWPLISPCLEKLRPFPPTLAPCIRRATPARRRIQALQNCL
jgi:hypothetical protein